MQSGFNPKFIDEDVAGAKADELQESINQDQQAAQVAAETAAVAEAEAEQAQAERDDPRNAENWGIGGVVKELQSAFGGGVQDTASSIVTLGERVLDTATGEIQEESKTEEGYNTEWDDWFVDDANPIETRTWWGGLIRSATHFGTMGLAIVKAAPVLGVGATAAGAGRAVTWAGGLVANQWARGAAVGAATDLVSKYSQDANALQMLRDRYGFIDTPLTTNDSDHPTVKTFKNVVEGMGIGELATGIFRILGKGKKMILPDGRTVDAAEEGIAKGAARQQSVDAQIVERGKIDLIEKPDEYSGWRHKDAADSHQGVTTSKETIEDALDGRKRQLTEWGAENGSPGSVTTPAGLQRAVATGSTEEILTDLYKQLRSTAKFKADIEAIKNGQTTMKDTYGEALEQWQRTGLGREAADQSPAEYLAEYFEAPSGVNLGTPDEMLHWSAKNVVAGDLLLGSLARELRDQALAGRELFDVVDVNATDGITKGLEEKFITVVTELKRAKIIQSEEFRNLGAGKSPRSVKSLQKKYVVESLDGEVQGTVEGFQLALKVAGQSDNDDLFKAIFETISMSDDIRNIEDFDNYIKRKLRGGEGKKGIYKQALWVKEMQGMMIHSILSGPKTAMRALMGTSTATFLRPVSTALGAGLSGDGQTMRAALASMNAMREVIPEAFTLFKSRLNSYWAGDVATVKSRFAEYTRSDEQWDMFADWIENSGRATNGDKAAFHIANTARQANDSRFLTYSTKIMASMDETFSYVLGRAKMREKAMREAMDLFNNGKVTEITPDLIKSSEDRFYSQIFGTDGSIIDDATKFARGEVTLTTELTGFSKGLNDVFNAQPWAKPFFLFARTGVNGLALTAKHTPGFNFLVKEWNDIAFADPKNLASVQKYGINSAEELMNAQALQRGRLAIGTGVISMAGMHFLQGGLTGNGPTNRQQRQMWIDAGYKPRSINIGGVWVSYDSFEPFNQILAGIADVGDHLDGMGEEWVKTQYQKLALVIAQAATSKTYLTGLGQFVDLFAGKEGQTAKITAGILNNVVPLAGLRNELGKLFNPHMKELNTGWGDAFRNRNLYAEVLSPKPLPTKYDMLNGKPIRNYDFPTRMFNMFSPVHFNLDQGPGRKLLFDSGYDLRMSTYYGPDGTDLTDSPELRSRYQRYIGEQNLEAKLDKLAADPNIQASIEQMNRDKASGKAHLDPMKAYPHNDQIRRIIKEAQNIAWAKMRQDLDVQQIQQKQTESILENRRSKNQLYKEQTDRILQMSK